MSTKPGPTRYDAWATQRFVVPFPSLENLHEEACCSFDCIAVRYWRVRPGFGTGRDRLGTGRDAQGTGGNPQSAQAQGPPSPQDKGGSSSVGRISRSLRVSEPCFGGVFTFRRRLELPLEARGLPD